VFLFVYYAGGSYFLLFCLIPAHSVPGDIKMTVYISDAAALEAAGKKEVLKVRDKRNMAIVCY
jgi:hypothetical protein